MEMTSAYFDSLRAVLWGIKSIHQSRPELAFAIFLISTYREPPPVSRRSTATASSEARMEFASSRWPFTVERDLPVATVPPRHASVAHAYRSSNGTLILARGSLAVLMEVHRPGVCRTHLHTHRLPCSCQGRCAMCQCFLPAFSRKHAMNRKEACVDKAHSIDGKPPPNEACELTSRLLPQLRHQMMLASTLRAQEVSSVDMQCS